MFWPNQTESNVHGKERGEISSVEEQIYWSFQNKFTHAGKWHTSGLCRQRCDTCFGLFKAKGIDKKWRESLLSLWYATLQAFSSTLLASSSWDAAMSYKKDKKQHHEMSSDAIDQIPQQGGKIGLIEFLELHLQLQALDVTSAFEAINPKLACWISIVVVSSVFAPLLWNLL